MLCRNVSGARRILAVLALHFAVLACGPAPCPAAFEGCIVDSRAEAVGDCWCVSYFPALSPTPLPPPAAGFALGLSYRRPFGLSDLEEKDVVVNVPISRYTGSVGYIERGGGLYRERALSATMSAAVPRAAPKRAQAAAAWTARAPRASAPHASPASLVSVCLSAAVFEVSVDGWRPARCASLSAGARASPVGSVDVCVGMGNIVSGDTDLGLRQTFLVGVVVRPHQVVALAAEIRRQPGATSSFHLGAELELSGGAFLRCGLRTEPTELTMGFGVALKGFGLDTASSFHPVLGRTDSFSLSFSR
jgi:hypothetical protein